MPQRERSCSLAWSETSAPEQEPDGGSPEGGSGSNGITLQGSGRDESTDAWRPMTPIIRKRIPLLIAVVACVVTLAGYFFPTTIAGSLRDQLVEWAIIVAAFAFVLGLFNVFSIHSRRVVDRRDGWSASLVLLLAAAGSWIPPVIQGPSGAATQYTIDYVIAPLGASLAALLVFTLTLAAFRLLRHRRSLWSVLFIVTAAVTLLGTTPLPGMAGLSDARNWLIGVPGMAGIRGLVLGVALGILITGLRVLLTQDRPYAEF